MTASLYSPWGQQKLPARSPLPSIAIVRMKLNSQHIQFATLSQSDAPQAQRQANSRERLTRILPALVAPAPFFRIFGAVYRLLRAFSSPCVHDANQARGCFRIGFHLLGLLGLHDRKSITGAIAPCAEIVSIRSVK